jgi:hypothetical protein
MRVARRLSWARLRSSSSSPSSAHSTTATGEAEAEGVVVFDYVQREPRLVGLAFGSALGEFARLAHPAAPAAASPAHDEALDPVALGRDRFRSGIVACAKRSDRARELVLGLGRQ